MNYSCCCGCKYKLVASDTNFFIRIQVVLCYMQSSTSSQQFWVIHTMPVEVYVSLTNLLQSSSLTTSTVIIVICFALIRLAFSLITRSLFSLLATNTRFALLIAYSYAIFWIHKQAKYGMTLLDCGKYYLSWRRESI